MRKETRKAITAGVLAFLIGLGIGAPLFSSKKVYAQNTGTNDVLTLENVNKNVVLLDSPFDAPWTVDAYEYGIEPNSRFEAYFQDETFYSIDQYGFCVDNFWFRNEYQGMKEWDVGYQDYFTIDWVTSGGNPAVVENNVVVYENVHDYESSDSNGYGDLIYEVTDTGVKNRFRIEKSSDLSSTWTHDSQNDFVLTHKWSYDNSLTVKYENLSGGLETWDGSSSIFANRIMYLDNGELIYSHGVPVVTDDNGGFYEGKYQLSPSNLRVHIAYSWLESDNRAYPITVDPSVSKRRKQWSFQSKDNYGTWIGEYNENKLAVEPKVTLGKWREENLVVELAEGQRGVLPYQAGNKVRWNFGDTRASAYPLENSVYTWQPKGLENTQSSRQRKNGGLEFDTTLMTKPEDNTITYTIDGAENMAFYYQPPLHENHPTWADSDSDGVADTFRPPNVVGSYAVYHDSKQNNEYKTGKLFHIYRPKIYDSENNWVWGDLYIDKNQLKVDIPDSFLDSAIFPIRVDPTFGYESDGGSWDSLTDRICGSYFTCPEQGTLDSLSMQTGDSAPETACPDIQAAIYLKSDNSHIATSEEVITAEWGWWTLNVSSSPSLSNTDYWLVWNSQNDVYSNDYPYDSVSDSIGGYQDYDYSNGWPDPWSPTSQTRKYSIYATYTATGNTAPDAPSNPSPSDGASSVSISTSLSVDVSDSDGDSMDVSFYWDNGDLIETVTGVSSGGTATTSSLSLNYSTTYNWYAIADDGTDTTQSSTWSFTTESAPAQWNNIESWTGSISTSSVWNSVESWSGTLTNKPAFIWQTNQDTGTQLFKYTIDGTYTGENAVVESQDLPIDIHKMPSGRWLMIGGTFIGAYEYYENWVHAGVDHDISSEIPDSPGAVELGSDGNWYIIDEGNTEVENYDSSFNHQGTIPVCSNAYGLEQMDSGKWAVTRDSTRLVTIYSSDFSSQIENHDLSSRIDGNLDDVEQAPDGSYWLIGHSTRKIFHYDTDWNYIENFDITTPDTYARGIYLTSAKLGWNDVESLSGSLTNTASWNSISSWSGIIEQIANWFDVESWTGSLNTGAVWQAVMTWTGSISGLGAWQDVESWNGNIEETKSKWNDVVSWTGSLTNTASWSDISSWTGTVQHTASWKDIESWSGSVYNTNVPPTFENPENIGIHKDSAFLFSDVYDPDNDSIMWTSFHDNSDDSLIENQENMSYPLIFDGDDYVNFGDTNTVDGSQELSVIVRVSIDNFSSDQAIITNDVWGSGASFLMWADNTGFNTGNDNILSTMVTDDDGDQVRVEGQTNSLPQDEYQTVAFSFEPNSVDGLELYSDFELVGATDTTGVDEITDTTENTILGASNDLDKFLDGEVEHLAMYTKHLTKEELREACEQDIHKENLSHKYLFEEAGSSTLWDNTGNADGEINGATWRSYPHFCVSWQNLEPETTYSWYMKSTDGSGEVSTSDTYTFTTLSKEWHGIESLTGTVTNSASWSVMDSWTGTVQHTASWHDVESILGSIQETGQWNDIETWNGSIIHGANWHDMQYFMGVVQNHSTWHDYESWSGSINNVEGWHDIDLWTGSIQNIGTWYDVKSWTGNVFHSPSWHDIETWTGAISHGAVWSDVETWTGNLQETGAWHDIERWSSGVEWIESCEVGWQGESLEGLSSPWGVSTSWYTEGSGSYYAGTNNYDDGNSKSRAWKSLDLTGIDTLKVDVRARERGGATGYIRLGLSGETVYEFGSPDAEQWYEDEQHGYVIDVSGYSGNVDLVIREVESTGGWEGGRIWIDNVVAVDNTGAGYIYGSQAWHDIKNWTGTIKGMSWKDAESWSGTIEETSTNWYDIESWTGSFETSPQWEDVETWTGSINVELVWNDIDSLTGNVKTTSQWNVAETWTGSLQNTPNWHDIKTQTGQVLNESQWHDVETWTTSLEALTGWSDIETWTGSLKNTSEWYDSETWTGELSEVSEWHILEDWTGAVDAPSNWKDVENWTGVISHGGEWYDIETWTGSLQNSSEWHSIISWSGSVANIEQWQDVKSISGQIVSSPVWNDVKSWSGSLYTTASWYDMESWTVSLESYGNWRSIVSWTGEIINTGKWKDKDTFIGSITEETNWHGKENWTGTIAGILDKWRTKEKWTGEITTGVYILEIKVKGEGTTDPVPDNYEISAGKTIEITTEPSQGWEFDNWTGDFFSGVTGKSTQESPYLLIEMTEDRSITANFSEVDYQLSLLIVAILITSLLTVLGIFYEPEYSLLAAPAWLFTALEFFLEMNRGFFFIGIGIGLILLYKGLMEGYIE